MWADMPHHLCPNSCWFTAWHVVKLWCITKSSITRKIFSVTCGHHTMTKNSPTQQKSNFAFTGENNEDEWSIELSQTSCFQSPSIGKQSERSRSHPKCSKQCRLLTFLKIHWINLVYRWPTRCNQKTLPIQSCIVSMSCFFVDGLSTCISLQHQRCQRSHLFNITQDFLFSFPGARERWKKGIYAVSKGSAELHVSLFTVTTIGLLQSVKGAHRPVKRYLKKVEFNIVECGLLCLFSLRGTWSIISLILDHF